MLKWVPSKTKERSHSINNSSPCYLYPATTWSCCGLVTNIAVGLHADTMVGLVADFIAVGLLADTTVSLHATHGLPFFCTFAHATRVCFWSVLLPTLLQFCFLPTPWSVFTPLMDFHSSALSLMLVMCVFGWSCCQVHCSWASCWYHSWSWDWTDLLCLVLLQQNRLHHLGAVLELRHHYGQVIPWLDVGTGSNPCLPCMLPSIQMGFQLHCAGLCQDHQKPQLGLQLCIILVVLACGVFIFTPNHSCGLNITFESFVPQ